MPVFYEVIPTANSLIGDRDYMNFMPSEACDFPVLKLYLVDDYDGVMTSGTYNIPLLSGSDCQDAFKEKTLGVAWSDSCEKEYLNKLPRLCWVMTVTPCWPHGFRYQRLVSSFRIFTGLLVAIFSLTMKFRPYLTWDWEHNCEFEGKLFVFPSFSPGSISWTVRQGNSSGAGGGVTVVG